MHRTISAAFISAGCLFASVSAHGGESSTPRVLAAYAIGDVPESLTVAANGDIFYSNGNTIWKRTSKGDESVFSTLPIPVFALGVKVGPDGCVYNTSVSLDPTIPGAFLWKSCIAGSIAQAFATLDQQGGPNDLAFDDEGNAFVTDPFLGKVWKVTPEGDATVWLSHPLLEGNYDSPYLLFAPQGVNGIAFDEGKRHLYLGVLDYGRIVRVPMEPNGQAGAPTIFAADAKIQGADGIAFDEDGQLFVAVNGQNKLVRISPQGRIEVLVDKGLDSPSSLAFGRRNPGERHKLYIANSAFMRTFGLQPGAPAPAILKATLRSDGLALP